MKVIYNAPPGDSKVVEMGGLTFFDGVATEVDENSYIAGKLKTNQHFTVKAPRAKAEKADHDKHAGKTDEDVAAEAAEVEAVAEPEAEDEKPVRRRRK